MSILSKSNCGTLYPMSKFMHNNKWIVSVFLIALGVVLLLFGGSKWDKLFPVYGFLIGFLGYWYFLIDINVK